MIRRAGGCMRTAPETGASREGFERTHSEVWQRVIRSLPLQQGRFPFMGQETGMPFPDWTPFPLCAMEVVRAWETEGFPEPPRIQASPTRNTTQNMFFPNPLPVFIMTFWACFEFLVNQVQGYPETKRGQIPALRAIVCEDRQRLFFQDRKLSKSGKGRGQSGDRTIDISAGSGKERLAAIVPMKALPHLYQEGAAETLSLEIPSG